MKKITQVLIMKLLLATVIFADITGDAEAKVNEVNDALTGNIALAIMTLVIIIAGWGLMFNKFSKDTAIRIGAGGLIIGIAGGIAELVMG